MLEDLVPNQKVKKKSAFVCNFDILHTYCMFLKTKNKINVDTLRVVRIKNNKLSTLFLVLPNLAKVRAKRGNQICGVKLGCVFYTGATCTQRFAVNSSNS